MKFEDLTLEQKGGLVIESLKKGEYITVGGSAEKLGTVYKVTNKANGELRIRRQTDNKLGKIFLGKHSNTGFTETGANVATTFLRDIESDIVRSSVNKGNMFDTMTESYVRAIAQFAERQKNEKI